MLVGTPGMNSEVLCVFLCCFFFKLNFNIFFSIFNFFCICMFKLLSQIFKSLECIAPPSTITWFCALLDNLGAAQLVIIVLFEYMRQ